MRDPGVLFAARAKLKSANSVAVKVMHGPKFVVPRQSSLRIDFSHRVVGRKFSALKEVEVMILPDILHHLSGIFVWLSRLLPWLEVNTKLFCPMLPLLIDVTL